MTLFLEILEEQLEMITSVLISDGQCHGLRQKRRASFYQISDRRNEQFSRLSQEKRYGEIGDDGLRYWRRRIQV